MASLRQLAACIGLPENFSVVGGFFGYASLPPWNQAPPQANLPQSLSLLKQMKRLKQKHFRFDLVRVGTDSNGLLSPTDEQNLDCAVRMAREIYGAIGVGIGRVNRWIPLYDNTGFDVIDDDCEASDLIDEFGAPGGRNRRVSGALLGRRRGWAYARSGRIKREGLSWHGTNLLPSAGSLLRLITILVSLQ